LPALELPVLELPVLELPVLELPVLELPVLELPVLELPVLDLPVLEMPPAESPEALKFHPSHHRCSCSWSQKCRLECPEHPLCTSVQPVPRRRSTARPRPQ
jgi:hypothetical protein